MISEDTAIRHKLQADALAIRIESNLGATCGELLGIKYAANAKKIHILSDTDGFTLGYVAWAGVNKASALQLVSFGMFPRYHYEWAEGNICLITDVVFKPGFTRFATKVFKDFIREQRAIIFMRHEQVRFYLRRRNRFVRITNNV